MKTAGFLVAGLVGVFLFVAKTKTATAAAVKSGYPLQVAYLLPENAMDFLPALHRAEINNGLPAGLLARMAYQESRFRDDIIYGGPNHAGAVGILQIIPRWHPDVDPTNPYDSIEYAGGFVRRLYERFGQWDKTLAAYNWGPTNVSKKWTGDINDLPEETRNYVLEVGGDVGLFA